MVDLSDGAILAFIGLGGGLALGLAARLGRFCTLGAVEDALYGGDFSRLRMWAVALGAAIILANLAANAGYVSFETSIYSALVWNPLASVVGGLMFGYGMALAGNCGYGALARLGGGDLRSFVVVIVAGLSAAVALGGPLASTRAALFPPFGAETPEARGIAFDLANLSGISPLVIAIAIGTAFIALALSDRAFRRDGSSMFWAVVVALSIVSGWVGTTWMVETSFEDVRAESHTFTAPLAGTMFYLMTSSAGGLSFAIGSVVGVLAGALLGSVRKGHFRWEACDDPRELGRQIFGAACMGIGGVVALGCSIGQGLTAFSALTWSAPVTLLFIFIGAAIGLRQLIQGLPGIAPGGAPQLRRFRMWRALIAAVAALLTFPALADEDIADQYPQSPLYQKPVEVIPNVWSAIGATAPPTYENTGHNNNLSFIVTGDGVVVVNAGAAYVLAEALHKEIREVTDQPVVLVVNENGQGHAMLGNTYWAEQGVPILAHEDAAAEWEERGYDILDRMQGYNRDKAAGSDVTPPTETFADQRDLSMGGVKIVALHLGPAHSPGDISIWLPDEKLVIAGDMAFHERLLPIFDDTDTAGWLETWETAFEPLGAIYVIPGHGHPTNMAQVRRYTHDYLAHLRGEIRAHIDAGGELADAYYVDQSAYAHLHTFNELATRNAGRVFEQMEWE